MMKTPQGLHDLEREHPEWKPWLAVVGQALLEVDDAAWDAAVPRQVAAGGSAAPLLARAIVEMDRGPAGRAFGSLVRSAQASGTPAFSDFQQLPRSSADACALFLLALNRDDERLKGIASKAGIDGEALHALAALLTMPFLHACNRRFASLLPAGWAKGYCPVCGAWAAYAEVRGIERARHLRCGNCGGDWQAHGLTCLYCGTADHDELASLVPEQSGSTSVIEVCNACRGYLKVFTTLKGSTPAEVMLQDLASADLDIAAAERGYKRPLGAGYVLNVTLAEHGARDACA